MLKKIALTVLILSLMVGVSFAGGVQSDNSGNAGYLFVATGENHGKDSIGVWTDPSFLKGQDGAIGEQGIQGVAGQDGYTPIKGVDYFDGENGLQGLQGIQGERGEIGLTGSQGEVGVSGSNGSDGLNGEQGLQGLQGVAGQIGEQGLQGLTGQTGSDGKNGEQGKTGNDGKEGKQGIQGERGKGLEDRYEVIGEVRLLDTKRTTWSVYAGRDFNNNINIIGAKVTVKIGRSYYEKKIDALEAKVNNMVPEQVTETITKDKDGNVVSIHMSNNDRGASFSHSF